MAWIRLQTSSSVLSGPAPCQCVVCVCVCVLAAWILHRCSEHFSRLLITLPHSGGWHHSHHKCVRDTLWPRVCTWELPVSRIKFRMKCRTRTLAPGAVPEQAVPGPPPGGGATPRSSGLGGELGGGLWR